MPEPESGVESCFLGWVDVVIAESGSCVDPFAATSVFFAKEK